MQVSDGAFTGRSALKVFQWACMAWRTAGMRRAKALGIGHWALGMGGMGQYTCYEPPVRCGSAQWGAVEVRKCHRRLPNIESCVPVTRFSEPCMHRQSSPLQQRGPSAIHTGHKVGARRPEVDAALLGLPFTSARLIRWAVGNPENKSGRDPFKDDR